MYYYHPHTNSFKRHTSAPSLALQSHMAVSKTSFNAIATLNICNKNLTVTSRSSNQDKRLWCDLLTVRKLLVAGLSWKTSLHHVEEAQVNRQRSEELELSCLPHRVSHKEGGRQSNGAAGNSSELFQKYCPA